MKMRLYDRLSFKQASITVVAAFFLGLCLSLIQLTFDLNNEKKVVDTTVRQVLNTLKEPAAQAAYNLDQRLGNRVIEGLFEYRPIYKAQILDDFGDSLASRERSQETGSLKWLSQMAFGNVRTYTVPLTIEKNNLPVGNMSISVDTFIIAQSFFDRAGLIIMSGLLRNLILAGILLFLFYYTLTKPLMSTIESLSNLTTDANADKTGRGPASLAQNTIRVEIPPKHARDELGLLLHTFNDLWKKQKLAETEIRKLNTALEERVRQRTAELEKANAAKSDFLAKMSHELRTPLNAIIGITEMMEEDCQDHGHEDYAEPLQRVRRAGQHLLTLINDILDLSKIEAGKMELHVEHFNIGDLAKDVISTSTPLAQKNDNRLHIEGADTIGFIKGDPMRISQVLLNLLSNACKFTSNGDIFLTLSRKNIKGQEWVALEVCDTGIGMSEEQITNLFEEFTQANPYTERKYGGTGLGLSISQRLSSMMGGRIDVDSTLGEGSIFTLLIPTNTMVAGTIDIHAESDMQDLPSPNQMIGQGQKILAVDDDIDTLSLIERTLAKDGIEVITCTNGKDAIKSAIEHKPAAITLDILMPGMNGWQILSELKALPETADIPVIITSVEEETVKAAQMGAKEYMIKPINRSKLRQLAQKYVCREQPVIKKEA